MKWVEWRHNKWLCGVVQTAPVCSWQPGERASGLACREHPHSTEIFHGSDAHANPPLPQETGERGRHDKKKDKKLFSCKFFLCSFLPSKPHFPAEAECEDGFSVIYSYSESSHKEKENNVTHSFIPSKSHNWQSDSAPWKMRNMLIHNTSCWLDLHICRRSKRSACSAD